MIIMPHPRISGLTLDETHILDWNVFALQSRTAESQTIHDRLALIFSPAKARWAEKK